LLEIVTFSGFVSEKEVLYANAEPCLLSKLICSSYVLKSVFILHLLASWGC